MLIGIAGEFRVDGEPYRTSCLLRQLHGELHPFRAARLGCHVLRVLIGRQDVSQDGAQLHLTQDAARLHIRQDALQIPHAGSNALHVAQPPIHRLELIAYLLERRTQAVVQRGCQLLVHRHADCLELALVVGANIPQLALHGLAQSVDAPFHDIALVVEPLRAFLTRRIHAHTQLIQRPHGAIESLLLGKLERRRAVLQRAHLRTHLVERAADLFQRPAQRLQLAHGRRSLHARAAQARDQQYHDHQHHAGKRHRNDSRIHSTPPTSADNSTAPSYRTARTYVRAEIPTPYPAGSIDVHSATKPSARSARLRSAASSSSGVAPFST